MEICKLLLHYFVNFSSRSGKSKGIAYVDFETEAAASAAVLKMDQHELNGQTVS